ncbi:MAG: nucleotidyl transferase AbiEii/AbiGii toxin family protein [Cyanobacteriota bacterium]
MIVLAAKELNLLPIAVEKDYWVTHILRELSSSGFKDEFIFKGGTCLSKAYKVIYRFSEDIDLLFVDKDPDKPLSKNAKKRRLQDLNAFILNTKLYSLNEDSSIIKKLNAKLYYNYPKGIQEEHPGSLNQNIILEPGYRGGNWPVIKKSINSLVAEIIINKTGEYVAEDLSPFDIKVLALERIFLEKLVAVYSSFNTGQLNKKTRHYYDLYMLMNTDEIKKLIINKELLNDILLDIAAISKEYFSTDEGLTIEMIKNCDAFSYEYSGLDDITSGYIDDKDLYYSKVPDFKDMLVKLASFLKEI